MVHRQSINKKRISPTVSIIMSVWNEEEVIKKKIENLLSLNYQKDNIEILISSDGSTDQTNMIIQNFNDSRIRFFEQKDRNGKMRNINFLVEQAKHEIIIFTDARQIFDPQAVQELIDNFNDPIIGCVSGELIFSDKEGGTAKGVNLYWHYEKFIRKQESAIHSMLGATGAIYAIRREFFTEIPEDVVLDDVFVPLEIIRKQYRTIMDDKAKAYDEVADSPREEHRRKARTLFGNYQLFKLFPDLFNPFQSPIAFQLLSHKLLRVLIPFFMIAICIVNGFLLTQPFYKLIFMLQFFFYGLALVGALVRHQTKGFLKFILKVCYIPYVFCLLNFSALIGFFRFTFGKQDVTWQKARTHGMTGS